MSSLFADEVLNAITLPGPAKVPGTPLVTAQVMLLPSPAGMPESLTYAVPENLIGQAAIGAAVLVPLGGREHLGYILDIGPLPATDEALRLKPIQAVPRPDPAFDPTMLACLRHVSQEYLCSLGDAMPLAVPERHGVELQTVVTLAEWDGSIEGRVGLLTRQTLENLHLALVQAGGKMARAELEAVVKAPNLGQVLRKARTEGWVREERVLLAPRVKARTVQAVRWTGADLETIIALADWNGESPGRLAPEIREALDAVFTALVQAGGRLPLEALAAVVSPDRLDEALRRARENGWVREERTLMRAQETGPAEEVAVLRSRSALGNRQEELLERLKAGGAPLTRRDLQGLQVGDGSVDGLVRRGLVEKTRVTQRRAPKGFDVSPDTAPLLSPFQQSACDTILGTMRRGKGETLLLFGVTGSGKTEVYLHAIQAARAAGRTAALLVPEISLTAQVAAAVRRRLGDKVAILHSALSEGERFDEWERLRCGEADVVVGPRSALFAPIQNPSLIILDEEHDGSYKQDEPVPRYHARDVARERARLSNGCVVLGSATPSMETFHRALTGQYQMLELPERVAGRPLPTVEVVDMREEIRARPGAVFSKRLEEGIRARLADREQVILFLNRRGFSAFLLCRDCGHVPACPSCDVSLTLHRQDAHLLLCHHCGHARRAPTVCERCMGPKVKQFGLGTQRVEETVRELFPTARLQRLDRDAISTKDAHTRIVAEVQRGEIDILIGTQMVTKGFDFPGVTLVGVIAADVALNVPDFRAAERGFHLLTQVSGRAGRGSRPGEVVVQTFNPDHPSVRFASHHDYRGFYSHEIKQREELGYPPFGSLVRFVVQHLDEAVTRSRAEMVAELVRPAALANQVQLLGPTACPLSRLRDRHRWHLMLKAPTREAIRAVVESTWPEVRRQVGGVIVDVEPVDLM